VKGAAKYFYYLLSKGIVVRDRSNVKCEKTVYGYTVGNEQEKQQL
jgi:histidinol-phosphate/aromatic aminotransferase/cobyric acid decarboxylase-like protein